MPLPVFSTWHWIQNKLTIPTNPIIRLQTLSTYSHNYSGSPLPQKQHFVEISELEWKGTGIKFCCLKI